MQTHAANLAMSMQLPAKDPYSILHARCWGNPNSESEYIKTETIHVPSENNLSVLEPREFQVLDFGFNCPILPDRTSRMLIRNEYTELWKYAEDDRRHSRRWFGGVVLTGHPGIGKSFGLYFYLFQNLLAAQPIALQTDDSSFFIFVESGVYLVRLTLDVTIYDIQSHLEQLGYVEGMIALIDSNEANPSLASIFFNPRLPFYIIQTTAPTPSAWTTWTKQSSASILVMKPWSWHEIFVASALFLKPCPAQADLHSVFKKYGPVPRVCFHLAGNDREIRAYDQDLRRTSTDSPSFLSVLKSEGFSEAFSHLSSVLLMIPDESRLPMITTISAHINRAVASRIPTADISEIYRIMHSMIPTKKAGRDLFQTVILQRILGGLFSYELEYFYLPSGSGHRSFGFQGGSNHTLQSSIITFGSMPTLLLPDHCYVFDKAEGLRSYDAIIRTYQSPATYIHLLKVVADYESPILLPELDHLREIFSRVYSDKSGYGPGLTPCYWRLVFIVPSGVRNGFEKQSYVGVGKYAWGSSSYFMQAIASV